MRMKKGLQKMLANNRKQKAAALARMRTRESMRVLVPGGFQFNYIPAEGGSAAIIEQVK